MHNSSKTTLLSHVRQSTRKCMYCHVTDGGHTMWSSTAENPMLHANFTALSSIELVLLPIKLLLLHCGNTEFCVLLMLKPWLDDLHIYELDPYTGRCTCRPKKLSTSRLSKVIILHTDRQTYRHTATTTVLLASCLNYAKPFRHPFHGNPAPISVLVWVRCFIEPDVLKTMYRSTIPLRFIWSTCTGN